MTLARPALLATGLALMTAAGAIACSSSEPDDLGSPGTAPAYDDGDRSDLAALGITLDPEEDFDVDGPDDDTLATLPSANPYDEDGSPHLELTPVDAVLAAALSPRAAEEVAARAAVGSPVPYLSLAASGVPSWWKTTYACPKAPHQADCVCRGSVYNCQFPNPDPGRNRDLPSAAIQALNHATAKALHATSAADAKKVEALRQEIIANLGRWRIAPNTPIYDGAGTLRGAVTASPCFTTTGSGLSTKFVQGPDDQLCVKINYGQTKRLPSVDPAATYVYVFDVGITPQGAGGIPGAGWIPVSAITTPGFVAANTPDPPAPAATTFTVNAAADYGCATASFAPEVYLPAWTRTLKVRPMSTSPAKERARDYLLRDGNTINLAYQTPLVGGAATDTFVVVHDQLSFVWAKGADARHKTSLTISLYAPGSRKRARSMTFLYGSVDGRFGWLPAAALKKPGTQPGLTRAGAPAGGGSGDVCAGRADGVYCNEVLPFAAYVCQGGLRVADKTCPDTTKQRCTGPNGAGDAIVCK